MANTPVYLLTDFSCCEDFEKFLKEQNHANRALLDTLTQNMVDEWNKKACNIAILGGNLCLLDKDGKTIASVPMLLQDGDTITRDPLTGKITCVKVNVMGLDKPVKMWMGSISAYKALKTKSPNDTVYFFTDINLYDVYNLLNNVSSWVTNVNTGNIVVPKAKHAEKATNADDAAYSVHSSYADGAGRALNADHAAAADSATNATNADTATILNNNGLAFGRALLWKYTHVANIPDGRKLPIDGTETTFNIEGVSDKFIVVEIRGENGALYGTQTIYKVRTPAFNCKDAKKESIVWRYKYSFDGFSVEFRCDGDNKLCVRRNAGSTDSGNTNLYILAIYEEL